MAVSTLIGIFLGLLPLILSCYLLYAAINVRGKELIKTLLVAVFLNILVYLLFGKALYVPLFRGALT